MANVSVKNQPLRIRPRATGFVLVFLVLAASQFLQNTNASVVLFDPTSPVEFPPFESPVEIDVDGNGTLDFLFSSIGRQMDALPQGSNRSLIIDQFGTKFGSNLDQGSIIGAVPQDGMRWDTSPVVLGGCASGGGGAQSCPGEFQSGLDFLGLEFEISGQTHYGWIEIESIQDFGPVRFHRWAYESEPGMSIRAGAVPEPSAGMLLCVTLASCLLRRRR